MGRHIRESIAQSNKDNNHKRRRRERVTRTDNGYVLIIVLWVTVVLSFIAIGSLRSTRVSVNLERVFEERTKNLYAAKNACLYALSKMTDSLHMEGGITADNNDDNGNQNDDLEEGLDDKDNTGTSTATNNTGTSTTANKDEKKDGNKDQNRNLNGHESSEDDEEKDDSWLPNTEPYIVLLDDIACDVYIEDEGGKINLNSVSDESKEIFLDLLTSNGIEEEDADVIVDSTIDWIDKDDWHHINGAESPYYESLAEPYEAKNTKFDSIEELRLVKGVTPDVYESIRSFITVFGSDKINLNFADKEVLISIPEINEEMANAILEHIENHGSINSESELKVILSNPELKTKDIPIEKILEFVTLETQDTVTIRSICSSSDSSKDSQEKFHQYRIIVTLSDDRRRILAVYAD